MGYNGGMTQAERELLILIADMLYPVFVGDAAKRKKSDKAYWNEVNSMMEKYKRLTKKVLLSFKIKSTSVRKACKYVLANKLPMPSPCPPR